jgi:hypothetical protein
MKRKAVLCGINNYASAQLKGCLNDIANVYRLLVQTFDFQEQDIHLLKDGQVVKSRILEEWRWLTQDAQAGDTLVFHFSGHGSHVHDRSGDETDLRDEISCLYDMDFNNPETYLSDDEWYDLVQPVNPAANLIIIKDTCHSGGSSRFLGVRADDGTEHIILADVDQIRGHTLEESLSDHTVSNARFLVPPDIPAEAWRSHGLTSTRVKPTKVGQANHVSLMACMETQTAADAYISGSFNGAFTYYLCDALRRDQTLNSDQLIEQVRQSLQGRYTQVPQHEGKHLPPPIFGSPVVEPPPIVETPTGGGPQLPPLPLPTDDPHGLYQVLLQTYMQLFNTLSVLQGRPLAPTSLRSEHHTLVAVHGIGNHGQGYSNGWWQALAPHVDSRFEPSAVGQGRQEVMWSDLVNESRALARSLDARQVSDLRESILEVIEDRRDQLSAMSDASEQIPSTRGVAFSIDDFLTYMLNESVRRQIIQRFTQVVEPLLARGETLDIISHSWGTVVAYEGLRELEHRAGLTGRVNQWFTVGSALSIYPVQRHLRPENRPKNGQKAPYPRLVKSWINLDAEGDLVGGRLGRHFPVTKEYLKLPPVSCQRQWWGYELGCAHSSYFDPANRKVNHDIFAAHILGQS